MSNSSQQPQATPRQPSSSAASLAPLSDDEAMAQVVGPAKEFVQANQLQDVTGGFAFASCNDQGEPPYRATVDMSFALPAGADAAAFVKQIASTMILRGWVDGPPPGQNPFGTVIHTDEVMAVMGAKPNYPELAQVQLYGQCRNMVDHRDDGTTNGVSITDQLRG